MSHTGKTALITGGCSGLGRAIAEMFLERGANVVVCDVNEATTDDFREKVSEAHPGKTIVLKRDITHQDAIDDMFIRAEGIFKKIDFVINNAGILDKFDPVGDLERDLWDRIIAVNLTAPAMITKAAVNSMLKNNVKGSIVNISSIAAVRGFCAGAAYTVSKHGLLGLTKNTGYFYGEKGIRCNAIMAGGMKTNIAAHLANGINVDGRKAMVKAYPDESAIFVETEKVAKLVSYLCSEESEIVNGACIAADNGWQAS